MANSAALALLVAISLLGTCSGDECAPSVNNMYCDDSHLMASSGCDVATSVIGSTCSSDCDQTLDYTELTGGQYSCDDNSFYASGVYMSPLPGCYVDECEYSYSYDSDCDQYTSQDCSAGSLMVGRYCGDDDTCMACILFNYTAMTNGLYSCDNDSVYYGGSFGFSFSSLPSPCFYESCDDHDDDNNDDDDDCVSGYKDVYCDDSIIWYMSGCDEMCSNCASEVDWTAWTGGMYTCTGDSQTFYNDGAYQGPLPGCHYEECSGSYSYSYDETACDFPYSYSFVMFDGSTSGYGADLDVMVPRGVWDSEYTLKISFTMPDDLDDIGDWDGLLGHDDGDHPYPYFNQFGLWFEKQNGPHPQTEGLEINLFSGGESYTVTFRHWVEDGGDCFYMLIDETGDEVNWCYDFNYRNTPRYAGCGYGKGDESFSGSVTKITIAGHYACDSDYDDYDDYGTDDSSYVAVDGQGCSGYIHMDDERTYGVRGGSTTVEECAAAVRAYDGQGGCNGDYFFFEYAGYCNCPTDGCGLGYENDAAGSDGQLYMFFDNDYAVDDWYDGDCKVRAYCSVGCECDGSITCDMHDGSGVACCGDDGGYCGEEWGVTGWVDICSCTDFFRVSPGCSIDVATGSDGSGDVYTYDASVLVCGYDCDWDGDGGYDGSANTPGCDAVRSIRVYPTSYSYAYGIAQGDGWCHGGSDEYIGDFGSAVECFEACGDEYGGDLLAIDWWSEDGSAYGRCYCQDACECMSDVGDSACHLVTVADLEVSTGWRVLMCNWIETDNADRTFSSIAVQLPGDCDDGGGDDVSCWDRCSSCEAVVMEDCMAYTDCEYDWELNPAVVGCCSPDAYSYEFDPASYPLCSDSSHYDEMSRECWEDCVGSYSYTNCFAVVSDPTCLSDCAYSYDGNGAVDYCCFHSYDYESEGMFAAGDAPSSYDLCGDDGLAIYQTTGAGNQGCPPGDCWSGCASCEDFVSADCSNYGCCDVAWAESGAVQYCCSDDAYSYDFGPGDYPMCADSAYYDEQIIIATSSPGPTILPTVAPTSPPTAVPTALPTSAPSPLPTSPFPTPLPSPAPSRTPVVLISLTISSITCDDFNGTVGSCSVFCAAAGRVPMFVMTRGVAAAARLSAIATDGQSIYSKSTYV